MSLMELMGNVGPFGMAVMVCLAMLSIYSVGVILQKQRRFRAAARQSQKFKPVLGNSLRADKLQGGTPPSSTRARTWRRW